MLSMWFLRKVEALLRQVCTHGTCLLIWVWPRRAGIKGRSICLAASRIQHAADSKARTLAGAGRKYGRRKAGTALNKLLAFLMPIAGQKILLLLGLAIVRTALSNRLARMQVGCACTHACSACHPCNTRVSTFAAAHGCKGLP